MSKDKIAETLEGIYVTIGTLTMVNNNVIYKMSKALNLPPDQVAIAMRNINPVHKDASLTPSDEDQVKSTKLCKIGTEFLNQIKIELDELIITVKTWDDNEKEEWRNKISTSYDEYTKKVSPHNIEPPHLLGVLPSQNAHYGEVTKDE